MPNIDATFDPVTRRVTYIDQDGFPTIHEGGNRQWRNNNPTSIFRSDDIGVGDLGSIGVDDGPHGNMLVFPDYETGRKAAKTLLDRDTYRFLDIAQAINRWVEGVEPDKPIPENKREGLEAYRQLVKSQSGLNLGRTIFSLGVDEFEDLVDAMERSEGYWRPDLETRERIIISGTVSRPGRDLP